MTLLKFSHCGHAASRSSDRQFKRRNYPQTNPLTDIVRAAPSGDEGISRLYDTLSRHLPGSPTPAKTSRRANSTTIQRRCRLAPVSPPMSNPLDIPTPRPLSPLSNGYPSCLPSQLSPAGGSPTPLLSTSRSGSSASSAGSISCSNRIEALVLDGSARGSRNESLFEQMLERASNAGDVHIATAAAARDGGAFAPRDAAFAFANNFPSLTRLGVGLSEFGERTFLLDSLPPMVKSPDRTPLRAWTLIDELKAAGQQREFAETRRTHHRQDGMPPRGEGKRSAHRSRTGESGERPAPLCDALHLSSWPAHTH